MAITNWVFDAAHSELGFKIKHLMISNVSGAFKNFTVNVQTAGEDFSTATVEATVEVASISTNNEKRDAHLLASDFFEAEKYPQMKFRSTRVERLDDDTFNLHGDLSLKGVTKPVVLTVEYSGVTKDPWGGERAGFMISGKINRTHWGLAFNALTETGGLVLGEEVKINSEVQLVKQEAAVAVTA